LEKKTNKKKTRQKNEITFGLPISTGSASADPTNLGLKILL
jgi:hypothetical protein